MKRRIISALTTFAMSFSILTVVSPQPASALTTGSGSGLFALVKSETLAYAGVATYSTIPTDMKFSDRCGSAILPTVNFTWTAPANMPSGISSCGSTNGSYRENYTAMITGYILAPTTGSITFSERSDDGFILNINGTTVISNWVDQGPAAAPNYNGTGTFSMVEGNIYPIKIFYHQTGSGAAAGLYWNTGSGDEIVPQTYLGLSASDLGTGCAVGESQYCPADNARQIKNLSGTNTNGKYWINVGGVSTQTYALMDSNIDGGGWMLGMKGLTNAQGNSTALGYDANVWNTNNTLQAGSDMNSPLSSDNANAKNNVFNYTGATEALVIWRDLLNRTDGYRYTNAGTYGFSWKESLTSSTGWSNTATNGVNSSGGCPITAVTLLTLFTNANRCKLRDANSSSPYDARGATVFSSQNQINFFGFNYYGAGATPYKKVRFGFGWNENNAGDEASNDVVGGIGLGGTGPGFGAGDYIGCCQSTTGINRQAGFEFYVRNSALNLAGPATATASAGTSSIPWTKSGFGTSVGATQQFYYFDKFSSSDPSLTSFSIDSSTGAISVDPYLTGGTYRINVSMIDTYGQVASTMFTLTVNDASASAMSLSTGTLSPTFAAGTTSYTAGVSYSTTSVTVTATASFTGTTFKTKLGAGSYSTAKSSGTASDSISLAYGANTIVVQGTANDGTTTREYTIVITRTGPPAAPTSLSATAGNGQVSISFTAGVTNGESISNYKYSTDGTNYTAFSPAQTTSPVTISGLTNGTAYTIYLKAVNAAGDSPASASVSATPKTTPSAPTTLSATVGSGQLTIAFTAGADGGSAITNYKYSTDGTNFTALSPVDATSPVTISNLTNGTSYSIYLKAVNAVGDSVASSVVTATPNAIPTISVAPVVTGTTTRGQTLSVSTGTWLNGPTSYAYTWWRATTSAGVYSQISGANSNTYVLTAADTGNFIKAEATGINSAGSGTASRSAATSSAVIATDPVVLFDAGSSSSYSGSGSTWNDISGNGFNSTLTNSPTYSTGNGGLLNFSASSLQNAETDLPLPALSSFTVEAWFKLTAFPTGDYMNIASTVWDGSGKISESLWLRGSGNNYYLDGGFWDGASWRTANADISLTKTDTYNKVSLDTWYHAVTSYDGTTLKLYINNSLVASSAQSGLGSGVAAKFRIGQRFNQTTSPYYFTGAIPVVKIYNRAISSTEVATDFNYYAPRYLVPTNSSSPAITGTATLGQTLTVSNGTWTNTPSTYTYSWSRSSTSGGTYTAISGATSSTYTVTADDVGQYLKATVTATNTAGTATSTSSSVTIVGAALTPSFGSATPTADGFTFQITNYDSNFTWIPSLSLSATISISGTGFVTVSGVSPGTLSRATISTSRTNYGSGSAFIEATSIASANANLSALTLSIGTLSPTFASATTSYTAAVTYSNSTIRVTPTQAQANATITVNGTSVTSGSASNSINLNLGSNTITIVVTAQDGTTSKTYTVTVTRRSNDATLTSLSISAGTLSPTFASATTSYTATVGYADSSITVTPTSNVTSATIQAKVGSGSYSSVTSGSASSALSLSTGSNTVTISVTAEDGTTKDYILTVTRLKGIADLTLMRFAGLTLNETFATATTSYTLNVSNSTTSVTVLCMLQDTLSSSMQVKVNSGSYVSLAHYTESGALSLNVGSNTVSVLVTAQDSQVTKNYITTITRAASTDSYLSNLILSNGTLSPSFASATTTYTSAVTNSVSTITVTPTLNQADATLTVDGSAVSSGVSSSPISLALGANTITIVVTAQDGTSSRTYTLTVTRQSNDATLSGLVLSAGTLSPTFSSATTSYTTNVKFGSSTITVTPTRNQSNATMQVKLGSGSYSLINPGSPSNLISLLTGSNVLTILVTAQDGTTKTYTITVTRATAITFINSLSAPTGDAMAPYSGITFSAATGGTAPFTYTYSVTGGTGALPAGLSFSSSSRTISGTPTTAGTSGTIKITATDAIGDTYTMSSGFTITIRSGTQLPITLATLFGTGGQALNLVSRGGSGTGTVTYTVRSGTNTTCSISGSTLTATTSAGVSGICYVTATKAADGAFTSTSSPETTVFFTAYVPVITQSNSCPSGTSPSAPTGIGVAGCQPIAPVTPLAGDSGAAPKITSLSVTSGLIGTSVTITGTGFSTATRVQFGSKSTSTFSATTTTITVAVPTGATTGRVMVYSPTGTAMASQIFTVIVPDVTAPSFLIAAVNTSTPTQINLTYNESLASTSIAASAFVVQVVGSNRTVNSVTISGTTVTLTLASAVTAGQIVAFTYTSPGDSTAIQDAAGNQSLSLTSTSVTGI